MFALAVSPISPSSRRTWDYISDKIRDIVLEKVGRSVVVKIRGEEIRLPPYPEVNHVKLVRENGKIIPDVPDDWVAEWKANGSNIRIYCVDEEIIALTRGGFLLDWKPYINLVESPLKKNLISATENGRFLLFGELVGPKSLVKLCVKFWKNYIGGDIGYLLFDVYDIERGVFISLQEVRRLADKHGLMVTQHERIIPEKLMSRMEEFLKICGGEVWEGFVFKDTNRGTPREIAEKTLKWRLDETKEYAERIYRRKYRDPLAWRIYEAFRKFIIEGYTDPPITVDKASDEAWKIRDTILSTLNKLEEGEIPRDKADKKVKDRLYSLAEGILSQKTKHDKLYRKSKSKAIKIFRKIHVFTF